MSASPQTPSESPRASTPPPSSQAYKVHVSVRVRPFLSAEEEEEAFESPCIAASPSQNTITVIEPKKTSFSSSSFSFDTVYSTATMMYDTDAEPATQEEVFDVVGRPLVDHGFSGLNSCLFAYGQTGAGKTYTMMGSDFLEDVEQRGAIPRLCYALFERQFQASAANGLEGGDMEWNITVGYIEIYNEKVSDLLSDEPFAFESPRNGKRGSMASDAPVSPSRRGAISTPSSPSSRRGTRSSMNLSMSMSMTGSITSPGLAPLNSPSSLRRAAHGRADRGVTLREDSKKGVYVEGLTLCKVQTPEDALDCIDRGNMKRHVASTMMNARSSRSHTIVQFQLEQTTTSTTRQGRKIKSQCKFSKINLVDLAGSERVNQSQALGTQFDELRSINLSLTTLGKVIDVLADMAKGSSTYTVPPFRDSRLTLLLKDSLGGNSRTFMVACINPTPRYVSDSINTLRYASRAREIVNTVRVNEDPHARRIRWLEEEIANLKSQLTKGGQEVSGLKKQLTIAESEVQQRVAQMQYVQLQKEKADVELKALRSDAEDTIEMQTQRDKLLDEVSEAASVADERHRALMEMQEQYREREIEQQRLRRKLSDVRSLSNARVEELEQQLAKEREIRLQQNAQGEEERDMLVRKLKEATQRTDGTNASFTSTIETAYADRDASRTQYDADVAALRASINSLAAQCEDLQAQTQQALVDRFEAEETSERRAVEVLHEEFISKELQYTSEALIRQHDIERDVLINAHVDELQYSVDTTFGAMVLFKEKYGEVREANRAMRRALQEAVEAQQSQLQQSAEEATAESETVTDAPENGETVESSEHVDAPENGETVESSEHVEDAEHTSSHVDPEPQVDDSRPKNKKKGSKRK